jgi:hypothetical protein
MVYRKFILIPTFSVLALMAQAPDATNLLKLLTSLHTRLYSVNNLLIMPYGTDPNDVKDWRKLMADIDGLAMATGNKDVTAKLKDLKTASEDLIYERRRAWDAVRPCIMDKNPTGLSRIDREKLDLAKLNLGDAIQGNIKLQRDAKDAAAVSEWAKNHPARKSAGRMNDALSVLERLGLTLQLTLEKYDRDLLALAKAKKDP